MTYVIAEPCADTRDASCVTVCPVDCIHPRPDEPDFATTPQLYVNPDECISCDACVLVCPTGAPMPADCLPDEWRRYEGINAAYFRA
jgi:ferredoxin